MLKNLFDLSFRCYYENGNKTEHRQKLRLSDIPKWVEAYRFTHPECVSVTVKIWLTDIED